MLGNWLTLASSTFAGFGPEPKPKGTKFSRGRSRKSRSDSLHRSVHWFYGTSPTSFNVGRLISVARPNSVINYAYDRFGRITQDGAMSYQLDANGNRTTLTYPLGVQVQQTFDFADRPRSSTLLDGANPPQLLAFDAVYEPFGPLASLSLGNGLAEQRTYTTRYFPQTIQLPGRLSWSYATDKLGNPTAISDLLTPATSRSYTYLDSLYFLTGGVGPWGNWSWSYDKIGNRLSETKNGALQNYTYVQQGAPPQNTPKLATRGAIAYGYDAIGNLTSANTLQLTWDDARNLRQLGTQGLNSYDGRGFLAQLSNNGGADAVTATYGSEGQLFHRHDLRGGGVLSSDTWFFDFGGRPLASLEKVVNNGTPQTLLRFYTTDHLNTPVVATDAAGAVTWTGGFDPFGGDSFSSAQKLKSYHRFPGQWQDNQWYGFSKFADFSYNLHRWYDSATGRYTAPDPQPPTSVGHLFAYALSNPEMYIDSDGRFPRLVNSAWLPSEVPCLVTTGIATAWSWIALQSGPRFAHCYASCLLAKCGGQNLAIQMGANKEFFDLAVCKGLLGEPFDSLVTPVRSKHCHSAFQASDFEDDRHGLTCPEKTSCDERCGRLRSLPDTAGGPFE